MIFDGLVTRWIQELPEHQKKGQGVLTVIDFPPQLPEFSPTEHLWTLQEEQI